MEAEDRTKFDGDNAPGIGDIDRYWRGNFNTELTPEEEWRFTDWVDMASKRLGRDVSDDLADYDLRGAFKAGCCDWPDKYRKPSHPLFSTASIYNGVPDPHNGGCYEGGECGETEDGRPTFRPSCKMLDTTHPVSWLKPAVREADPKIVLIMPERQA